VPGLVLADLRLFFENRDPSLGKFFSQAGGSGQSNDSTADHCYAL
jgi:hypothetical protein